MRKLLLGAIGAAMALSFSVGHADQTNACVATDTTGIITPGQLSCSYTAKAATGQVTKLTPNKVKVTVTTSTGTTTVYDRDSLDPGQGQATFATPIGSKVEVTVGPDTAAGPVGGAVGLVIIGDAS